MTALDYDFKEIESSIRNKVTIGRLQFGWIAGIVYFLLGFFEAGIDFARFEESLPFYFPLMYTAIKTLVLVSFTFFMIGFVEVGRKFESPLLKVSSYLMVGSLFVIEFYDIISIFSEMTEDEFFIIKSAEAMVFGGVDVVFGIALFRLGKTRHHINIGWCI